MAEFKDLEGRLVDRIVGLHKDSDEVLFYMHDGAIYKMYHHTDCCEHVSIAEIVGELDEGPWDQCWIVRAEESSEAAETSEEFESGTWTFYRLDTTRGCIVIRWLGRSNGYYSESVNFEQEGKED
jgi:hypothetical protein